MTIWTVGHSTRSVEEFLEVIGDIERIIDVRTYPGSNRFPHFNQENMPGWLGKVKYTHIPELGGRRRKANPDSPNLAWRSLSFRNYADYMAEPGFSAGYERLLDFARSEKIAYMCSEAVWWKCHRGLISDKLKSDGHEVIHIMGVNTCQEHPYTSAATIVDGALSYSPPLFEGIL
ncbi:MAG: DUF488 domain-containing protein [Thiohalomonadaceae bacterium]